MVKNHSQITVHVRHQKIKMQIILINKNSIDFNSKLTRFNNVIIKVEGDTLVFDGSSLCFGSLYLD